jgi:hypothetical protein
MAKQKYFISKRQDYATTNSLQKQGRNHLLWLEDILVDDLAKLEATVRSTIDLLNKSNTRCRPLEVEFSLPQQLSENYLSMGYVGIKAQFNFYIYPVDKDYTEEKEVSNV